MANKSTSKLDMSGTWISDLRKSPPILKSNHEAGKEFARKMELKSKAYRGRESSRGKQESDGWFYMGAKYGSAPKWGAISKVWTRTPWIRKYSNIWAASVASSLGLKKGKK